MGVMEVIIDGVEYEPRRVAPKPDKEFGLLIRQRRKDMRWTLEQAALRIGCAKSYLHGMERGQHEPSLRVASDISKAYGLSIGVMALALPVRIDPKPAVPNQIPLKRCAAHRDGECHHDQCPQLRDGEPAKTGRHCPLDTMEDD